MSSIYYCDWAAGNDTTGNGTYSTPYKTIDKGVSVMIGGDYLRIGKSPDDTALTGTLGFTYNSTSVTGSSTLFSTELALGDYIKGGDNRWYEVTAIGSNTGCTLRYAYAGSNQSGVSSYKKGLTSTGAAASSSTQVQAIGGGGTYANPLYISGGWDLSTQTQTGTTNFQQLHSTFNNRYGYGLYINAQNFIYLSNFGFFRYSKGLFLGNNRGCSLTNITGAGSGSEGLSFSSCGTHTITNYTGYHNVNAFYGSYAFNNKFVNFTSYANNGSAWIADYSANNEINGLTVGRQSSGITSQNSTTQTIVTDAALTNVSTGLTMSSGDVTLVRPVFSNVNTPISVYNTYEYRRVYVQGYNGTANDDRVYWGGLAVVYKQSTTRQVASGYAWKIDIIDGGATPNNCPSIPIARFAVNANAQVTFTAYMKKDHATNVGGRIVCRGKQLAGIDSDVEDIKANDTDWEQLTLTLNPTEAGVIQIDAEGWFVAGFSAVYVDTVSISQA